VKGIILYVRPKKSAKAYQKIWWDEGSPLVIISERFVAKMKDHIQEPVALAMRYGSMTIANGIKQLVDQGVDEIVLVPLYPHYAMSSYETVVTRVEEVLQQDYPKVRLATMPPFYKKEAYLNALAHSIQKHLEDEKFDHVLFSYHGIPERHIKKSDPTKSHCRIDGSCCNENSVAHHTCYRHQCFETTKLVAQKLGLKEGTFSNSFQSRLLRDPWLKPYTDFTVEEFPEKGVKKLAVVTPAFMADCLETLEEIAMEASEEFIEAGGTHFKHIPCLNDSEEAITAMTTLVKEWLD
jgi:ferrochelatase